MIPSHVFHRSSGTTPWSIAILLGMLPACLTAQAVAEGFLETRSDRPPIHVLLFQSSGGRHKGCAQRDVLVGDFAMSVRLESGKRVTTLLNSMMGDTSLRFFTPQDRLATIVFDDYNDDGRPDFALSRLGCGTMSGYYLFTISRSGRVQPLPIEGGSMGMMEDALSVQIPFTREGLATWIYDNSIGKGVEKVYRWNPKRGLFEPVRVNPQTGGQIAPESACTEAQGRELLR